LIGQASFYEHAGRAKLLTIK